jgi:hypothetical protein
MKPIQKLIDTPGHLAQLKRSLERQQMLLAQVRKSLPPPLDKQLLGATLNDGRLSLWVDSPAWASRLRYMAPQLLRQLRQQGLAIDHLRPLIVPQKSPTRKRGGRRPASLSRDNAKLLLQTAEALEAGPLQEALRRLSRHHQ